MFFTMADHLLAFFILLLICNTGFSAEISVFVQTGDSVQLDIQTQKLPEFDILYWTHDKSENIVMFIHGSKVNTYKDRVDFNTETFSLTLKNTQKTDSGLYRASTSGASENIIITYRVSVIDAVEAPVLTGHSNWSSDSCVSNFTCRAHDLTLSSTLINGRCSPEEVTSHEIYTLTLDCSEEFIICNHSNPVSWKKDRINIKQLCGENEIQPISHDSSSLSKLVIIIGVMVVVGVIVFSGLLLYCCCKNNKGVKQSADTDYDNVETQVQTMTGDTWTTITYRTVGHQTPSSAHAC